MKFKNGALVKVVRDEFLIKEGTLGTVVGYMLYAGQIPIYLVQFDILPNEEYEYSVYPVDARNLEELD